MPERAEIVAWAQVRIGDTEKAPALLAEDGYARHPPAFLPAIAHIGGEARALVTHHRKAPAAAFGEVLLRLGRIRARDHEGGAVGQMIVDAVKSIGPERAVAAGGAHIVDHEEIAFVAEELG